MTRPSRPPAPRRARGPDAPEVHGPLPFAARALLIACAAVLALRLVSAMLPGRWLWGYDLARDLAPTAFVTPFVLTLLTFVPALSRGLARLVPRSSAGLGALTVMVAIALAGFVWTHPDRGLYNGDTSLRHGAFAKAANPERLAEQALRGDLVLHHALPRAIAVAFDTDTETANRMWGTLAALLSLLGAWLLAWALGAGGAAGLTAMVLATSTGALALFNGYGKSTVELAVLTLYAGVGLVLATGSGTAAARARDSAMRRASGALITALALAAALLLHRSALALVPVWLATWILAASALARPSDRAPRATAPVMAALVAAPMAALVAALVAPLAAWAVVGRELVRIMGAFDTTKHLHGGLVAAFAFAATPRQVADVVNALGILLPAVPLVPVLGMLAPRPDARAIFAWSAFVLPPLALLVLATPQHGLPRDWDVFTLAGVALAALASWRLVVLFEAHPRAIVCALPVACVALVPALQWVALQSDPVRTWARAESVLLGPPLRPASERAYGFGTIGTVSMGRGNAELARRMFERSAEAAPNPSTFVRWGMAETMLGRPAAALQHYRHAAMLDPELSAAWRGIAAAGSALGDRAAMTLAVEHLTRLTPADETLHEARAWLAADDSLRRLGSRR